MGVKILPAALSALALLVFIQLSAALQVSIGIREVIDSRLDFGRISVNDSYQEYRLFWENTGSAACRSRARIDFHNVSGLVYTSWSSEHLLPAGRGEELALHSILPPGNYSAMLRLYYCNEILNAGEFNTSVEEIYGNENGTIELLSLKTQGDKLAISVRSTKDISDLVILPERYPIGWIIESSKVGIKANETKEVFLAFMPATNSPTKISLAAASPGRRPATKEFTVVFEGKKDNIDIYIFFAALAALVFTFFLKRKGKL